MNYLLTAIFALLARLAGQTDAAMITIPAGPFVRGDSAGEIDERPVRSITLSTFRIDRTEVTYGAYAACVAQKSCRPPQPEKRPPGDDVPVTGITWHDAAAYCALLGKRLPTEAEWEKAARGDRGQRYPWGDAFDCRRGNFGSFRGEGRCADRGAPGHPVAVGSYPSGASPYGVLDLAGNVWEWVADRYAIDYYRTAPGKDPRGPEAAQAGGDRRVLRGGGCCSIFGLPRGADRLALPADYRDVDIGFRCAL